MNSTYRPLTVMTGGAAAHSAPRRRWTRRASARGLLAFSILVLVLIAVVPLIARSFAIPSSTLIYPASALLTTLFIVQMWSWYRVSRSNFDPYTIFATAAMLFNGSRATLEVFGANVSGVFGPAFQEDTTVATIYLVTIALWCFHIGGMLGAPSTQEMIRAEARNIVVDSEKIRKIGWGLVAIAILPVSYLLREAVIAVMSSGYFALFQGEKATSWNAIPQVLAAFLLPGALFLEAGSRLRRFSLFVSAILVASYALMQLFLGSRALAVASIVPYVWLWGRCIKPIPRLPALVCGLLVAVTAMQLVGRSRMLIGEDRVSPEKLMEQFASLQNPVVAFLSEVGGSAITVAYTYQLVPESRPYAYGRTYLQGAFTCVPNLFWKVHPAIAQGTPETWLIQTVDPRAAAQGGGLGYSFIAEAYLNFGWPGVIICCGALGFGFARLAAWSSNSRDLAKMACAATIVAFTVKYARSDCSEILRGVVWYAIGPYVIVKMITARARISSTATRALVSIRRPLGEAGFMNRREM